MNRDELIKSFAMQIFRLHDTKTLRIKAVGIYTRRDTETSIHFAERVVYGFLRGDTEAVEDR